jgi:hypothetical protein
MTMHLWSKGIFTIDLPRMICSPGILEIDEIKRFNVAIPLNWKGYWGRKN